MIAASENSGFKLPQYSLFDLTAALNSTEEEQRHNALFLLADLVSEVYGDYGRVCGETLRAGGISSLVIMLADPASPLDVIQQALLILSLIHI